MYCEALKGAGNLNLTLKLLIAFGCDTMLIVYIAIIVIVPILSQCIRTAIEANVKPEGFVTVIPACSA